ncbi:MFS transporter [Nocardioides deserti]|uniref:MFS transporter n=1 Tax=Nocardioides deserti TaxID=1588644 RepID=A0ABR6UBB6_9ACTN|nr:MFS transporter [Nocardioides deserti]MBC2961739.1 MFS transporter [Nocardioides deserti]GGO73115.1 MFS transporter [Nocardioides deserti]
MVGTLALLTTVTAVVTSLGAPLVASVAVDYDVSLTAAQWTLTATLLTGAMATPVVGRAGSGALRRPVILGGLALVVAGCVLSALPTGFPGLLVGRCLQGVGLAITPLALAVARDVLDPDRMPATMSLLSVAGVAGAGLGFPLTALVAGAGGLGAAFWLGAGMTAATLVAAWRHVPSAPPTGTARLDWTGGLLLTGGIAAVLLTVSQGEDWGWASWPTAALAAMGTAAILAWVPWTLRGDHPLVDLRLAARPAALAAHLTALLAGAGMYAGLTLVLIVVQADSSTGWGLGHPVGVAGLMLLPYSMLSVGGSRLALAFGRRYPPNRILPLGCAVYLLSNVLLALAHDHVWQILLVMAVAGLGSGCTFAMIPLLLISAVPPDETSSMLSFQQVLRYLGFSVGSTLGVVVLDVASGSSGPHHQGFVVAALVTAGLCGVAGTAAWRITR